MSTQEAKTTGTTQVVPATVTVELPVRLHLDADGAIGVDVPALPGCVSGGETPEDALANVREAAEAWLLARHDLETQGWPSERPNA